MAYALNFTGGTATLQSAIILDNTSGGSWRIEIRALADWSGARGFLRGSQSTPDRLAKGSNGNLLLRSRFSSGSVNNITGSTNLTWVNSTEYTVSLIGDADGTVRAERNGVNYPLGTGGRTFELFIFGDGNTTNLFSGLMYEAKVFQNGNLTNHWLNTNGIGNEWTDIVGGNNANLTGTWPSDNSQWISYGAPAGTEQLVTVNPAQQLAQAQQLQVSQAQLVNALQVQQANQALRATVPIQQVAAASAGHQSTTTQPATVAMQQAVNAPQSQQLAQANQVAVSQGNAGTEQNITAVQSQQAIQSAAASVIVNQSPAAITSQQRAQAVAAVISRSQIVVAVSAEQRAQAQPVTIGSGGDFSAVPAQQAAQAIRADVTTSQAVQLVTIQQLAQSIRQGVSISQAIETWNSSQWTEAVQAAIIDTDMLIDPRLFRIGLAGDPFTVRVKPQRFALQNITPTFGLRIKNG